MNLALGALIIVLLLLPAFFFRVGISLIRITTKEPAEKDFYTELIRKNLATALSKLTFSEIVFFFSIIPVLLHLVSLSIIHLSGCPVDYSLLLNLFTTKQDVIKEIGNTIFYHELIAFLLYIIVESILALILGQCIAWLMLYYASAVLPILLGDNIWYQLFTGNMLQKKDQKLVDIIRVVVLCNIKEATVIYTGALKKFDIDRESKQLAYITLEEARSRDLRKELITTTTEGESKSSYTSNQGVMKSITPGKYFTIQGKDILNVNVTYYRMLKDEESNIIGMEELQEK